MLVLSRKKDEKIRIGETVTLMVIEIRGDRVRLGIEAPREIPIHREEVRPTEIQTKDKFCCEELHSSNYCHNCGKKL